MAKFFKKAELYVIWSFYPIVTFGGIYISYKVFIWSFGGKECFRYAVIREPLEKNWIKDNPRDHILGRESPLSKVPQYLETPGHRDGDGDEHSHHRNY